MNRVWPIALIVVAVVVIGVFAADTLGIIRVPSLVSGSEEEVAIDDEEIEEDLGVEEEPDRPRRPRRKPKKKPKPVEPPKKVDKPPPKPVKKGPRLTMPSLSTITTSKLPPEINRDTIHTSIAAQAQAFQRCLKEAIKGGDDLPNRVLVSMTASTHGKITENHIKDRTVERSMLGRCVLRKSGSIRLPMFSGDPITIAFPLTVLKD